MALSCVHLYTSSHAIKKKKKDARSITVLYIQHTSLRLYKWYALFLRFLFSFYIYISLSLESPSNRKRASRFWVFREKQSFVHIVQQEAHISIVKREIATAMCAHTWKERKRSSTTHFCLCVCVWEWFSHRIFSYTIYISKKSEK